MKLAAKGKNIYKRCFFFLNGGSGVDMVCYCLSLICVKKTKHPTKCRLKHRPKLLQTAGYQQTPAMSLIFAIAVLNPASIQQDRAALRSLCFLFLGPELVETTGMKRKNARISKKRVAEGLCWHNSIFNKYILALQDTGYSHDLSHFFPSLSSPASEKSEIQQKYRNMGHTGTLG